MPWFTCHLLALNIFREHADDGEEVGEEVGFRYKISVKAMNSTEAEIQASKIVKEKASHWQHQRFSDIFDKPSVKVTIISEPMETPEFPQGSNIEWFKMSEINK